LRALIGRRSEDEGRSPESQCSHGSRLSTFTSRLNVASVAGLAPARTGLKGRALGLLCIHGQKSSPRGLRHRVAAHGQTLTL